MSASVVARGGTPHYSARAWYAGRDVDRAVLETSSDRYVIVEYLAEGGMGAIYLGKKLGVGGFEKEVVLKQLLPEFTQEPKFIDLFLREARLSASLEHANIVHTIDLVNAGDDYFMVMEYVKGADLRTMLKRVRRKHKRFAPSAGVFIGHEILEALGYAHQKSAHDGRPLNLIHRDISPSNILLSGAGEVKLTDFGIAKASTHRSVFYKVKGKVGYMSPEQARGEPVDARSDLFSLGVVLYEVLVGERLFVGDIMSSASQIYAQPIQPPSQKRPEIPGELDAVILKALSLDPSGRHQSAEEFQEALTRVATRHRLLVGASEMSAHLKSIAGDDASMWLKLETFGHDRGEPTQAHGTSVLSTQGIVDGEDEPKPAFDLSDADEEEDDDSDGGDLLRARNRPPSLPTGQLTSVIAVRKEQGGSGGELFTKMREDEPPLPTLQPRRSEPIAASSSSSPSSSSSSPSMPSSAPRRITLPQLGHFGSDESRKQTVVRDTGSPRTKLPSGGHASPGSHASGSHASPGATRSAGAGKQTSAPPVGDATRVHPPSQAGFARQHDPVGAMPNPLGGAPLSAASGHSGTPGAATRRLPTSGIRPRPRGERFEGTAHIRRPRRIIGIMIVLLLIGIGVALGVAFSGPELEVIDPSVPQSTPTATPGSSPATGTAGALGTPGATSPTGTAATPAGAATGSGAARQPPPPSELPGPPPATTGAP
ncbi:MAG: serine/threonine protein kinase [bacterium]|nr:serine/threonine protein kinase [bacterium]